MREIRRSALVPVGPERMFALINDIESYPQFVPGCQAAQVLEGPEVNPNAQHREIWLRDPDGYVVVLAGPCGDLGPPLAPPPA